MPLLALAVPSWTVLSNLSAALMASALASFAKASALLLALPACLSASATYLREKKKHPLARLYLTTWLTVVFLQLAGAVVEPPASVPQIWTEVEMPAVT